MKIILAVIFFILIFAGYKIFIAKNSLSDFSGANKSISLTDNGMNFKTETNSATVGDFLGENKIDLGPHDALTPDINSKIFSGTNIFIKRAVDITIEADGKNISASSSAFSIKEALAENSVQLNPLDKTDPDVDFPLTKNLHIKITRINVEEKTITEDIAFKITSKNDSQLGWREQKITQAGQLGQKEVKYKITYKNGQEISRVALEKKITKDPIDQIVTQGTFMELGKAAKGQGTWYAWKGGLFAASTTIPRGSYAKVTNLANSKTVVVQINDYGPQGKGRIIDLDKVAFAKIAPIGAGVIGVKVEQILN